MVVLVTLYSHGGVVIRLVVERLCWLSWDMSGGCVVNWFICLVGRFIEFVKRLVGTFSCSRNL